MFEEAFIVVQPLSIGRDPRSSFDLELQKVDCVIGISGERKGPPTAKEDNNCNTFKLWGIFTIGWRKYLYGAVGVGWRGVTASDKIVGLVRRGWKVDVR